MEKLGVFTTYECDTPEQRLLARVVLPHEGYRLEKGKEIILGPITNMFYHPNDCYAYDIKTGHRLGRYSWERFEVIGVFNSLEELQKYVKTRSQEKSDRGEPSALEEFPVPVKKKKKKIKEEIVEQLSLF